MPDRNSSKTELLENLRTMLRDVFKLRREGSAYAKLSRAHGYADGYMRVLLDTHVVTKKELLELVAAERVRADGPATAAVEVDSGSEVAA